jgi:hypothetical protein
LLGAKPATAPLLDFRTTSRTGCERYAAEMVSRSLPSDFDAVPE